MKHVWRSKWWIGNRTLEHSSSTPNSNILHKAKVFMWLEFTAVWPLNLERDIYLLLMSSTFAHIYSRFLFINMRIAFLRRKNIFPKSHQLSLENIYASIGIQGQCAAKQCHSLANIDCCRRTFDSRSRDCIYYMNLDNFDICHQHTYSWEENDNGGCAGDNALEATATQIDILSACFLFRLLFVERLFGQMFFFYCPTRSLVQLTMKSQ